MLQAVGSVAPSRVLRAPEELSAVVDGWRSLAAARGVSYFATPDWVLAWWETVRCGQEAEVAVWEDASGAVEAVVALGRVTPRVHERVAWTFPAWVNLGHGPGTADHFGWPVAPARVGDVRAWVAGKAETTSLILMNLDLVTGVPFVPAGARLLYRSPCPRLVIPSDDEPLGRSRKTRNRIRHYERGLEERGVTFRWISPGGMTESVLAGLFDLHARRQTMMGRPSAFDPPHQELQRKLVALSGPGRGPAAVLAECDGRVIGVRYGFMWRDTFATWHMGWDPDWAPHSLGTVLDTKGIRFAGAAGVRVYDFMRGAEEYKYRLGAVDRFDETWLVPAGVRGRLFGLKYGVKSGLVGVRR